MRTAFVQMVMLRLQYQTDEYWLMGKYKAMKEHKKTRKSVIVTARKMSVIVYTVLKKHEPFDPFDPLSILRNPKYLEMSTVARRYVLAVKIFSHRLVR